MNFLRLRAAMFDLDGTLIDGFPPIVEALNQTLKRYSLPQMESIEIQRRMGLPSGDIPKLFGKDWPDARAYFLKVHDSIHLQTISPLPGSANLLAWLHKQGIPVAIVTNKAQERAEAQIQHLGWSDWIRAIFGAANGRPAKPNPALILDFLRELGVPPDEAMMVGDGLVDMHAARAAGVYAVGISGPFGVEELRQAGADICFPGCDALHEWLRCPPLPSTPPRLKKL